jgi:uncharacterized membrane protein YeiH
MNTEFHLPVWFDLGATFAFALTGAHAAIRRGYDIVGVFFLALAVGLGGGLIRDGVFLPGTGPSPLLSDPRYLILVGAATIAAAILRRQIGRAQRVIALIDALGLGAYAAFGTQKALLAGLPAVGAVLVGLINAAGGSLLRDIITRQEPLVFRPGQFYVLTALAGAVVFAVLVAKFAVGASLAAGIAIAITFVFRALAVAFNWRTSPVADPGETDLTP